jgi:hypothetical protein
MKPPLLIAALVATAQLLPMKPMAGAETAPIAAPSSAELDRCRDQIREILRVQGAAVLAADALQALDAELSKPFAVGGRSREHPLPPRDLAAGWELFVQPGEIQAVAEITLGDVQGGRAQFAVVTVRIAGPQGEDRRLTVTVRPAGRRVPLEELDRLKVDDDVLRKAGVKP